MRAAIVSTKGGTGKTTSATYLALALHRLGRTMLVDADPQISAITWKEQAEPAWPLGLPVFSLPTRTVHRTLLDLSADYEHVVIDTPPGDLGIIRSAIMSVQLVIVPVAPTGLDLNRIRPTFELLAELEPSHPVDVGVVLTRVRRGTRSSREAREVLEELQYPILETEIPLAEMYAGAFGRVPADLGRYDDLLLELMTP
jgi:chromosome partitioning protein